MFSFIALICVIVRMPRKVNVSTFIVQRDNVLNFNGRAHFFLFGALVKKHCHSFRFTFN